MIGTTALAVTLVLGAATPPQTTSLQTALEQINRKTGVYATAIAFLSQETVQVPRVSEVTPENVQDHLKLLIAKLPYKTQLIRMDLPKAIEWRAEEILAYARSNAQFFRKPTPEAQKDTVHFFGQDLPQSDVKEALKTLNLRPVYVVALKQAPFHGYWEATYGQMRLEQNGDKVTGHYATNSGLIQGVIVGNELRFTWSEQDNGTSGSGVFILSDDGMSFSGPWWNNSDPTRQAGVWTGKRIRR